MKKSFVLLFILSLCVTINAQLFQQDFSSSTAVDDYISATPNSGQFNAMSPDVPAAFTKSITNGALRFSKTASSSFYLYRNAVFTNNPTFVQLKFDFEATKVGEITSNPNLSIIIGSGFSSASTGMTSNYASRFGFRKGASGGDYLIAYFIDNINGAGGSPSKEFTGKQTFTFVVNNTGSDQFYIAPNTSVESIATGKADLWIGTTKGINDYDLKNTDAKGAISGFKIQTGIAASGNGDFDFDNIEMKELPTGMENPNTASLPTTPEAYLTLKHPLIWANYPERQKIVDNIKQYTWASSLFMQLKTRVDAKKNTHITNPATILNTVPAIPGTDADRTNHNNVLTSASEAAILYYITNDTTYAQYASDILSSYMDKLSLLPAQKYTSSTTGLLYGDWWLESRASYPKIAIIYDFVYNYVNDPAHTVYDIATNTRKTFNHAAAQKSVETMATVVFKSIGAQNCNHSVLAGDGALFNLLMIADDTKRDLFFNYFYNDPQNNPFDAYTWTLGNFTSQNIWDETFNYSKDSHLLVLQTLNIIDRYKPELGILDKNKRILEGYPFYENYYYPSGEGMRFGDAGNKDLLDGYQVILRIATRKNYPEYIAKTKQTLKYEYNDRGGRKPIIETETLEWTNPLLLLWAENVEDTVTAKAPTIATNTLVDHAGLVIQRNYNTTDVKTNGMMLYTGGAAYVHAHESGIDMSLYGKGQVLGAESSSGDYGTAEHENYRVKIASHNTVIANGSGKSGTSWATTMNKVSLTACEPKVNAAAVSENFSFSTQSLTDTYNKSIQQRTNSIIRTSPTTAYYFDIFRSKGSATNSYHDYIYHNIGDALSLKYDDATSVSLATSTKYATDLSGSITGWKYFESVNSSAATNKGIEATFTLNTGSKKMNVLMPAGINREYATALAPYTKGATNGYDSKKTPVIAVRQTGEAWDKPFIAIFEPTQSTAKTIKSVTNLYSGTKVVGAVVISEVSGTTFTDYIISHENNTSIFNDTQLGLSFEGRFAIVRTKVATDINELSLYIGDGKKLAFNGQELITTSNGIKTIDLNATALKNSSYANTVKIFPNPATESFTIETQLTEIKSISITDITGKTMYENHSGTPILHISSRTFDIRAGVYFVKVLDKYNKSYVSKLIVK